MTAVVTLVGWVIGLVTGVCVSRNNETQVERREFNNVDLRRGTHKKVVKFYKDGQEI